MNDSVTKDGAQPRARAAQDRRIFACALLAGGCIGLAWQPYAGAYGAYPALEWLYNGACVLNVVVGGLLLWHSREGSGHGRL